MSEDLPIFRVALDIRVTEPSRLFDAALAAYLQNTGGEEPEGYLGTAENPTIAACVLELLGPETGFLSAGFEVLDFKEVA